MDKHTAFTSESPRVLIASVGGSLILKGSETNQVIARGVSPEDLTFTQNEDEVQVSTHGDLTLKVPPEAEIEIGIISGDAIIKLIEGALQIREIRGNLTLKEVGETRVGLVQGELLAKHVSGDLDVGIVNGSARLRGIEGSFTVAKSINGNLKADDLEGDSTARVDGSITLHIDPRSGQDMSFTAGGSILCQLPEDASVEINFIKASEIKVNLGRDAAGAGTFQAPHHLTLGDGDARLNLSAGGSLVLARRVGDWEFSEIDTEMEGMADEIGQQVAEQMSMQWEMLENQVEAQLENLAINLESAGLSSEAAERMSRKAREASERATARAREKMQRAQEKIQRQVEAAQRRAETAQRRASARADSSQRRAAEPRRSWKFEWTGGGPQAPKSDPVTEDERLLILKMLEEKKVTLQEAENLLSALEGK